MSVSCLDHRGEDSKKKARPGLCPGPAKGRRPLETFYFDTRSGTKVVIVDDVRHVGSGNFRQIIGSEGISMEWLLAARSI
jgi:hypothetical protein